MFKKIYQFFGKRVSGLHSAAYLLAFFTLLSQLLALVRDRFLAHTFGAGAELDAYFAAFRVPDLIYILAASLVSFSVLMPFLARERSIGKERERAFLDSIFSAFFIGIVCLSAFAFVFAPALARLFFSGFSPELQDTTGMLMRIMLIQPILLGASNFFASITQLERRFVLYGVSPVFYNAGIIVGIVLLYPSFGLSGLAWGVVLGALLHFAPQCIAVARSRALPRLSLSLDTARVREVVRVSLPRALALSAQQLTMLALTAFAALTGAGAVAAFSFAWNLQSVPLSLIAASYGLAAFPALSSLWAVGKRDEFIVTIRSALRRILWWSSLAIILCVVFRTEIVGVILGSGAFETQSVETTATVFALFVISLAAQGVSLLLTRGYYAAGYTRTPLIAALCGAAFSIFLAFLFMHSGGVFALPLAFSLGSIVSALWLYARFPRDFHSA